MVLRRYNEPAANIHDVYCHYPLLRAKIWSRTLDAEEISVSPAEIRCHAAIWNFSDDHLVGVILDRVSNVSTTLVKARLSQPFLGNLELSYRCANLYLSVRS